MTRKLRVSWTWNDQEVEIEAVMCPAESDVGIMSPYPDALTVKDAEGKEIQLSQEDYDKLYKDDQLCEKLVDAYYEEFA